MNENFDKHNLYRLNATSRKDASRIKNSLISTIKENDFLKKKFSKLSDESVIDCLTYEVLRACRSREFHYRTTDGTFADHKFTSKFNEELKKHVNRHALGQFLSTMLGMPKKEIDIIIDLYLQIKVTQGKPVFRTEAYGQYVNSIENLSGVIPFWLEPKDRFIETYFLFRFSFICSQSELSLSREQAFEFVELFLNKCKSVNEETKKIPMLTIMDWIQLTIPQLSGSDGDLFNLYNKTISSKLSLSWALTFMLVDYSRIINWRRLEKQKPFIKVLMVNVIGPIAAEVFNNLTTKDSIADEGFRGGMPSFYSKIDRQLRSSKTGRLFKLKEHKESTALKIYKSLGSFGFIQALYPKQKLKSFDKDMNVPLDLIAQ